MRKQVFFTSMWQSLKNWFNGEEAKVELEEDEVESAGKKEEAQLSGRFRSNLHTAEPAFHYTMVETRSGRHASPAAASASGTPVSSTKNTSRRRSKPKESSPEVTHTATPLSPIDGDSIVVSSPQLVEELCQALPLRSRTSDTHDESIDAGAQDLPDSLEVVQETQDLRNASTVDSSTSEHSGLLTGGPADISTSTSISDIHNATSKPSQSSPRSGAMTKPKQSAVTTDSSRTTDVVPVPKHKRFSSVEPEAESEQIHHVLVSELANPQADSEHADQGSDDDDEDAPEEMTASAGAQAAKSLTARASQAIKSKGEAERVKRQRRDQDFKTQAQASKKRKAMSELQQTLLATSVTDSLLASTLMNDDDLPDELPDSVLATEPTQLQSYGTEKYVAGQNKRKRLDGDTKPAKDLKIGHTSVRVLTETNLSLAPAASRQSNNIKEAWLKARAQESKRKLAGYRLKGAGARSFLRK